MKYDGQGTFNTEIVGEAQYQDALQKIAGKKTAQSKEHYCVAVLYCERDNPYDPNAVAVFVDDRKVGYLSRDMAAAWRKALAKRYDPLPQIEVDAVVVGGWKDSFSEGHFGLKLDLF